MAPRRTKATPAPLRGPAESRQGRSHTPPALTGESPGILALRKLLREDLDVLSSWRPAALEGDGEAIHQLRIAVRRIRTTLVLFAPYANPIVRNRFNRELRRLGQAFGEARDWDVFLGKTLPKFMHGQPAREWLGRLQREAEPRMAGARATAELELKGDSLDRLAEVLNEWAEAEPEERGLDRRLAKPMEKLAPRLLERLARKVQKRGRDLDEAPVERLHDLRKSVKKLRYASENLAPIYPRKRARKYLKASKKLQSALGSLNDTLTARRLLGRLGEEGSVELAPALGVMEEWCRRRQTRVRRRLAPAWKKFSRVAPFW
jgi:triphosphatase